MKTSLFLALSFIAIALPACALEPTPLPKHSVFIHQADGKLIKLSLEMASNPQEEETGLMYRKTLDADGGMVFNFSSCKRHAMWMKNTYIPLDMIFVDCTGKIAAIIKGTTPLSEAIISPNTNSAAVIELNAGESAKLGLKLGDSVEIQQGIMQ
jgi:uncharacterized membrane protein (UPF0127 family)